MRTSSRRGRGKQAEEERGGKEKRKRRWDKRREKERQCCFGKRNIGRGGLEDRGSLWDDDDDDG